MFCDKTFIIGIVLDFGDFIKIGLKLQREVQELKAISGQWSEIDGLSQMVLSVSVNGPKLIILFGLGLLVYGLCLCNVIYIVGFNVVYIYAHVGAN